MALQPVQLDTLDWSQIVTAIQTRIMPDSQGKWTLQAPVDPGVTLLELFAWLLDQRIYWMNQVPDSLNLAILALLGESPLPAQAAVTLLQVTDSANPPRAFPVAPAGTLMQLSESVPPLIFTTGDDVTLLPVAQIPVLVNGVDYTAELAQCRLVPLAAQGSATSEVDILLSLTAPIPASIPAAGAGQFLSLMIDLETSGDIAAEWTSEAVATVPAAATLAFSYTNTSSVPTAFPSAGFHEGTQGLRRSGVLRLPLPSDWQPEAAPAGSILTTYKIVLQIQGASFTYPPLLRGIEANVVLAQHVLARVKNPLTSAWLPLPGNVVSLPGSPPISSMEEYPPIESSVQVTIKEPDGKVCKWQAVSDFSLSGPTSCVFVTDRAASEITFGDGLNGRLPIMTPGDTSDITVSYQAGGGTAGNVGEQSPWEAVAPTNTAPYPLFQAINLTPGEGGAESETMAAAIERSTANLGDVNRAVSQSDYETLIETTPGIKVQRAYAAAGVHPDFPGMTVPGAVCIFAVPYAPRVQIDGDWASVVYDPAPMPDQGALQAAQAYLETAKLIGGDVFVVPPAYRKVWLAVTVAVSSPLPAATRQAVLTGLQNFLDPLVGGDEGNGWPFGDPLRPSALLGVAQKILGGAGDVQSVAVSIDSAANSAPPCQDVTILSYQLVNLVHVDLKTQQRAVAREGLL